MSRSLLIQVEYGDFSVLKCW